MTNGPMEAMILAAGIGTRLLPLTRHKPKPLFPVVNRPLLALNLDYLHRQACSRIILNTHHLGDQVHAFLADYARELPALTLETRHEPEILGTGGGIKNTEDFWQGDDFWVLNGDVVTDMDLAPALEFHRNHQGPVTLILQDHPLYNNIVLKSDGNIGQFRDRGGNLAFTGIHLLSRRIFDFLPAVGFYDIIPEYQKLIEAGVPVRGYVARNHYWRDMGSPASYRALHREILSGEHLSGLNFPCRKPFVPAAWCVGHEAEVSADVRLAGWGTLGEQCRLASGCLVRNSILWEGVTVGEGVIIEDSIIGNGMTIDENIINKIVC